MEIMEAVCVRIRQLQADHRLSVNSLAAECGLNQSTLQHVVSGQRCTTSIATIQKLCDGLALDMAAFFDAEIFTDVEIIPPAQARKNRT